jgi:citrate synthase
MVSTTSPDKSVPGTTQDAPSQTPVPGAKGNPDGVLSVDGRRVELPRVRATQGSDGLRVGRVLSEAGVVTLDPGFTNTGSCESSITYIDGDRGILRYRGYPIEQLAKNSSFLEVAYLLIYGELPDAATLEQFIRRIQRHRLLHEDF